MVWGAASIEWSVRILQRLNFNTLCGHFRLPPRAVVVEFFMGVVCTASPIFVGYDDLGVPNSAHRSQHNVILSEAKNLTFAVTDSAYDKILRWHSE